MNNLIVRMMAGFVFTVVVIGSALLGPLALGILFLFFSLVGLYEFYSLFKAQGYHPRTGAGLVIGAATYALHFIIAQEMGEPVLFFTLVPLIVVLFSLELSELRQTTAADLGVTLMGLVYVTIPFSLVIFLANTTGTFEYELPLGFFLILWANDSFAYLVGKYLGRTKLYPKVSPNKTWEGLFGGVAFSLLTAWGISLFFETIALEDWFVVAVIVAVFANIGDLFESHLKRTCNVKDSGSIIPGHGGVLDRFDGLLFALPIVIAYFNLFHP